MKFDGSKAIANFTIIDGGGAEVYHGGEDMVDLAAAQDDAPELPVLRDGIPCFEAPLLRACIDVVASDGFSVPGDHNGPVARIEVSNQVMSLEARRMVTAANIAINSIRRHEMGR